MRKSELSSLKRACCWSACGRMLRGPLAGVLERERGGDDEDLAETAEPLGLEDHPAQPRVDRQPGEAPADLGEPLVGQRSR